MFAKNTLSSEHVHSNSNLSRMSPADSEKSTSHTVSWPRRGPKSDLQIGSDRQVPNCPKVAQIAKSGPE